MVHVFKVRTWWTLPSLRAVEKILRLKGEWISYSHAMIMPFFKVSFFQTYDVFFRRYDVLLREMDKWDK